MTMSRMYVVLSGQPQLGSSLRHPCTYVRIVRALFVFSTRRTTIPFISLNARTLQKEFELTHAAGPLDKS